jgi:pimeloyl-ACP methyl ester carboxylesterase
VAGQTKQRDNEMPDMRVTSADGTTLAARCSGHGSPIVLVHGANGDLDTFALIEGLLAERHSVWVYSRRGRGGSGDGPDYAVEREVEDVLAVLAATSDRAHLVGHSGGAAYCLLAAMHSPPLRSLVLYEPPLNIDRLAPSLIDDVQSAIDAGNPDRALERFFPAAGIVDQEVQALRSLDPVWARLREGVCLVPREVRAGLDDGRDWLGAFDPPAVPTLYLYGKETDAAIFPTLGDIAELLPDAHVHGIPGQRHLAFAFDPMTFAQAIPAFTMAHD